MKFTYDPRYNIAYISFSDKKSGVETIRVSDELNVDLAPDGMVYGIELLNANEQLSRGEMNRFLFINESTGERSEMPLSIKT